ncbi:MAG: hypothetical protein IJT39_05815 [Bacteroidales bacterium]|nr:hypothetical protein [Bacteroidales bacterium]
MIGRIIGIIVSVGLIIAGLSGEFVLKGTDSSMALVIFGVVLLIYDVYKLLKEKKKEEDGD